MTRFSRRSALLLAPVLALAATQASAAEFDGSYGKQVAPGETMQVVLVNNKVIAFYWNGDYTDTGKETLQEGGKALSFSFKGGTVTLRRAGAGLGVLLREAGRPERRFTLPKG